MIKYITNLHISYIFLHFILFFNIFINVKTYGAFFAYMIGI